MGTQCDTGISVSRGRRGLEWAAQVHTEACIMWGLVTRAPAFHGPVACPGWVNSGIRPLPDSGRTVGLDGQPDDPSSGVPCSFLYTCLRRRPLGYR